MYIHTVYLLEAFGLKLAREPALLEKRPEGHYSTHSSMVKDHINIRILESMVSDIPLTVGLGTRMSDPYVCNDNYIQNLYLSLHMYIHIP